MSKTLLPDNYFNLLLHMNLFFWARERPLEVEFRIRFDLTPIWSILDPHIPPSSPLKQGPKGWRHQTWKIADTNARGHDLHKNWTICTKGGTAHGAVAVANPVQIYIPFYMKWICQPEPLSPKQECDVGTYTSTKSNRSKLLITNSLRRLPYFNWDPISWGTYPLLLSSPSNTLIPLLRRSDFYSVLPGSCTEYSPYNDATPCEKESFLLLAEANVSINNLETTLLDVFMRIRNEARRVWDRHEASQTQQTVSFQAPACTWRLYRQL